MTVGLKDAFVGNPGNDKFTMEVDATWAGANAVNDYTGEHVSLVGDNRSFDTYDGEGGKNSLDGTSGNDALLYDTSDSTVLDAHGVPVASARMFALIEQFAMGLGDDVLDLTSGAGGAASYARGVTAYGDTAGNLHEAGGDDTLWTGLQLPTSFQAESTACRLRPDRVPLC